MTDKTLKGILFDLDDTLIDWRGFESQWEQRERRLMQGVYDFVRGEGHTLDDFEQLLTTFISYTRSAWETARTNLLAPNIERVMADTLVALGVPRDRLDIRHCLEAYNWGAAPNTAPFPDAIPALKLLIGHGVKVGIVTNAYQPMWMRDRELEQHGLLEYFPSCRLSAADAGYLKPHPSIFEQALTCLGTEANETIYIGDNPVADIAGAQGAGMTAVLRVTHPTQPMLSGLIVPDGAINSLEELPAMLDTWYPGWR